MLRKQGLVFIQSEWKHLFEGFQQELGEWATTNVETLSHLTHKTLTMERLAQSSERLGDTLTGLAGVCKGLIEQLQASNLLLTKSIGQLTDSNGDLKNLITQLLLEQKRQREQLLALATSVEATNRLVSSLPETLSPYNRLVSRVSYRMTLAEWLEKIKSALSTWKGSFFWLLVFYFFISSLFFFGAAVTYLRDRQLLLETAQKTQWLLEKANRRDCLDKIKKPDSPECQKFKKDYLR